MGHAQPQQSSSSGVMAAVLVAVLLLAILGVLVVVVGGLFFVGVSRAQSNMVVHEQIARATAARANADAVVSRLQVSPGSLPLLPAIPELPVLPALAPPPTLTEAPVFTRVPAKFVSVQVQIDRQGDASVDGEEVDLDALKAHLKAVKQEMNSRLSLELSVDAECLFKHVVAVMDLCKEIGDIEVRLASSEPSDVATVETVDSK